MSDTGYGKVVVNRAMSLRTASSPSGRFDGLGSNPSAAGRCRSDCGGNRSHARGSPDLGRRRQDESGGSGSTDYPFSGAMFLLSHRPLDPPDPGVSVLSGDIGDAVATALDAAAARTWRSGRRRCGPVLPARTHRRGPGLCTAGAARRRRSLLCSGMTRTELEPLSSRRSGDTTILRSASASRDCPTRKEKRLVAFSVAPDGTGRSGVGQCSGMKPDQRRTR